MLLNWLLRKLVCIGHLLSPIAAIDLLCSVRLPMIMPDFGRRLIKLS